MSRNKQVQKAVGTATKTAKTWVLSARSKSRMSGVHEDLKKVVNRAIELSPFDFGITSGLRTAEEQNALFQQGASQLDGYARKSRHQSGHAIDFVVYDESGKVTWGFSYYEQVSWAFKQAADELNIPITWGGDWTSFRDGPHVELKKGVY
ncbi:M15 family metallopeptidase [Vibrio brasiliensis]|uniref:M15 family metallopeptidase n=1 Tax=Vibrio brasiliensis TaxID=170652 RepID=UPI001EFD857D|nr:M15 family metallopeptidase [Vibrio brasiliensis]MCG9753217.1 M15 family metallopeptidase [Vibrio brasiliensis]